MLEPVWLGNSIVPRWEAFLLVGSAVICSCCYLHSCHWPYLRNDFVAGQPNS